MESDADAQELVALRSLSASIGRDPHLTQAAGGNTSLKAGDTLWIKASGTWLMDALADDIMVPVAIAPLLEGRRTARSGAEQAAGLRHRRPQPRAGCARRSRPRCMR